MIKWLRARSTHERWLLALIVLLLAGVITRWTFVKTEVAEAIRARFSTPTEQTSPTGQTEPTGQTTPLGNEPGQTAPTGDTLTD
ncbi:MAG: hypothetical protein LBV18_04420 [Alistipes sp.]|jgi:hypothetical protein|nr:hypothetical protein [Alistipes sp.]